MRRVLLVFLGGGVGALLRALALALLAGGDGYLPVSVLVVNLLGAFLLGVVFVLADEAGLLRAGTRLFVAVGVLGGFTTFSTFGWGSAVMAGQGQGLAAAVYVGASVAGGIIAVVLGMGVARKAVGALERGALGLLQRLNARGQRRYHDIRVDIGSIEAENRPGDPDRDGERGEAEHHPAAISGRQGAEGDRSV
jgi:fluoride exporter